MKRTLDERMPDAELVGCLRGDARTLRSQAEMTPAVRAALADMADRAADAIEQLTTGTNTALIPEGETT